MRFLERIAFLFPAICSCAHLNVSLKLRIIILCLPFPVFLSVCFFSFVIYAHSELSDVCLIAPDLTMGIIVNLSLNLLYAAVFSFYPIQISLLLFLFLLFRCFYISRNDVRLLRARLPPPMYCRLGPLGCLIN